MNWLRSLHLRVRLALADKLDGKHQVWEMLGEFLREFSVLILAFYPLEREYFRTKLGFAEVAVMSLVCLIIGVVIERRR
jgi:hypothetical protein